jgi:hypothetical protein
LRPFMEVGFHFLISKFCVETPGAGSGPRLGQRLDPPFPQLALPAP